MNRKLRIFDHNMMQEELNIFSLIHIYRMHIIYVD
jgi:hypothetical protein